MLGFVLQGDEEEAWHSPVLPPGLPWGNLICALGSADSDWAVGLGAIGKEALLLWPLFCCG